MRTAIVLSILVLATSGAHAEECGTRLTPEIAAALLAQERAGAYELRGARTEFVLQVPVTFHIVRRADGTGGISTTDVGTTLDAANNLWAATGIHFFQPGVFHYSNDDSLYAGVDTDAEFDALWSTDAVANTINVYFCGVLPGLCGRASFTTMPAQGVAVANGCTTQGGNTVTFAHELGHYFDLYHTHETMFGVECPDESNCSTAGDKVCDTPADPNVSQKDFLSGCTYVGNAMACGQTYSPDPTNLMSYGGACRDHFTQAQRDRTLATLFNVRSSLIQAPGLGVTWVDFNSPGFIQTGSYMFPFKTISGAESATNAGGTVVIKTGSNAAPNMFTKALHWDSFRGVAQIGP